MKAGDRVKHADADTPRVDGTMPIPAYRALRGTVLDMRDRNGATWVQVWWHCDPKPTGHEGWLPQGWLVVANDSGSSP